MSLWDPGAGLELADGKRLDFDLNEMLGTAAPPPAEYVVTDYLERASHLLLCGRGGAAKTMFVNQLVIAAVAEHTDQLPFDLDIPVHANRIVWFDAEMGKTGTIRRYWRTGLRGYIGSPKVRYIDAGQLNFSDPRHVDAIKFALDGADWAIFDSLRRLSASARENESDDMARIVGEITSWAHDIGPAILTIHHQGGDPHKWFRGSTAIHQQCDALVGWLPHQWDADEDDGLRRLAARGGWAKVRNDVPPEDRWFKQLESGLLVPADPPDAPAASKWDHVIEELLPFPGSKTDLAAACVDPSDPDKRASVDNNAWRKAYDRTVKLNDEGVHVARQARI